MAGQVGVRAPARRAAAQLGGACVADTRARPRAVLPPRPCTPSPPPRLFVYQPFRTPPPTEPLHHRPSQSLMVFVCTPPSAPRPACAVHHHWVALAWWRSAPGPHGRTARVAARVFPAVRRGAPAVAGGLLPRLPRLPSGPAQVFATTHLGVAAALAGVGDAGFADAVLVLSPLHGSLLESDGVARV